MSQVKWRECNFETEERTSQWQMEIWREKHWETQRQQSSAVLQLPHASAVIGVRCSELQQWSGGIEKSVSAQEVQTVPELPFRCAKFERGHKQSGRVAEHSQAGAGMQGFHGSDPSAEPYLVPFSGVKKRLLRLQG